MNEISKLDWMKTQELLVKLVQIMSPMTYGVKPLNKGDSSWSKKMFIPPIRESESLTRRHAAIQLLPNLLLAQKEMEEWIEGLEEEEAPIKTEKTAPSKENPDEHQKLPKTEEKTFLKESAPLSEIAQKTIPQKQPNTPPSKREKEREETETPVRPQSQENKTPARFQPQENKTLARPEKKEPPPSEKPFARRPMDPGAPIAKRFAHALPKTNSQIAQPAQKAIDEVRSAIRQLATSINLEETPKLDEVQTALKKIKPLIDQLVQAVTHQLAPEPVRHPTYLFTPTAAPFTHDFKFLRSRNKKEKKKRGTEKEPPEPWFSFT